MGKILVYVEHHKDQIKRSSQELLQAAQKSGQSVVALFLGSQAKAAAEQAGSYGAQEVHLINDASLDQYNSENHLAAVTQICEKVQPQIILASASSSGRDLFPRVAARLKSGLASDCVDLSIQGDTVTAKKPLYSGKCFATVNFANSPVKIILMRANQLPVSEPDTSKKVSVQEQAFTKPSLKTIVQQVVRGASEKLDLSEANVIVSGGRGLKEAGNFKLLENLAEVLGATVGASRAVVDAGWVSHGMQVGQTGKTVAPTLYIAVGISGAIQHLAGMSGSKVIVAINSDPNAPIFQKATYGIVGDLFDVLPKLTEEFKKVLHK